ncbi:MAG: site-specific integrase [Luteibacter sp.]|uniref:site-specific integrase n=1 Tax=Luteibacter sp. TaxID=1886636 RepID=UPI002806AF94|nr:site-specific integrase [Luteibacter sp.]MDQ7994592.1 site-specific integrase [Luteibacter sp.]
MPKPLFLHRPAGLYVRFRVPADLLGVVGSRFLVRPLKMVKGDRARLVAETMAVALSQSFESLRKGEGVDLKKALDAARSAGSRDLTLGEVSLPNGAVFRNVQIDTDQDARQFQAMVDEASRAIAPHVVKAPAGAVLPAKVAPKKEGLLSHQIAVHLGDLERANREKKTVLDSRHALRLFLGIVGDKPVVELNADDCRLFFDDVAHWPRNASKQAENVGLSVRDIIAKAKTASGEPPAAHTLSKHRQRLSVFINFLLDNDHLQKNPLKGIAKTSKFDTEDETGRAFTQTELDAIFEPIAFAEWSAKYPHRFWAPLIGLFTGARITEVSQLYVDDIATEHGVHGFHIRKGKPGQKLKNKSSLRFIPIAQPLLDAGFMAFVDDMRAAGQERLFPHLPNTDGNGFGRQMSRQFSTYIKARGVSDAGMGFHAFRHTMATRLDRAGVGHGTIARITGHGLSGGVLPKFYIDAPSLPERVTALGQFEAGVELPVYRPGQFAKALRVLSRPKRKTP